MKIKYSNCLFNRLIDWLTDWLLIKIVWLINWLIVWSIWSYLPMFHVSTYITDKEEYYTWIRVSDSWLEQTFCIFSWKWRHYLEYKTTDEWSHHGYSRMTAPSPIQVYIHVQTFQNGGKFSYYFVFIIIAPQCLISRSLFIRILQMHTMAN